MIKAAEAKKMAQFLRMKVAWGAKIAEIQSDSTVASTADAQIEIAELENKMELAEEEANKPHVPKLSPEQQLSHSTECKINSQSRQRVRGHEEQAFTTLKSLCNRPINLSDEAGSKLGRAVACSGPTSAFGSD